MTNTVITKDGKLNDLIKEGILFLKDYAGMSCEQLISSLTDNKVINGKKFSGCRFQVCYALLLLEEISSHVPSETITEIKSTLDEFANLDSGFKNFNYFDERYIPDDLDTASILVRYFKNDTDVLKNLNELSNLNMARNGLINTWFIKPRNYDTNYFENTLIFQREEFYHTDVMLNYMTASRNTSDTNLLSIIKALGLTTYWYIPTFYSVDLYSDILLNKGLVSESLVLPLRQILNELEESFPIIPSKNVCEFDTIKKIVAHENVTDNWINLSYILSTIANYQTLTGDFCFNSLSERVLNSINFNSNIYSLYWSIGLVPFQCDFLNKLIFIKNILRFKRQSGF